MTEVCAAMGLTNLDSLSQFVSGNLANYRAYRAAVEGIEGIRMLDFDAAETNNYQYIVLDVGSDFGVSRDRLIEILHAENILARRYFWPGCHRMEPYRSHYPNAELMLPNTVRVANSVVVLPTGSAITPDDVAAIASVVRCAGTIGK
jgi:dTDP-4-amino-4,6-dideoxygalactose transaminase